MTRMQHVVPVYRGLTNELLREWVIRYSRHSRSAYRLALELATTYQTDRYSEQSLSDLVTLTRTGASTVKRGVNAIRESGEWIVQSQSLPSGYRLPNRYYPVIPVSHLPRGVAFVGVAVPVLQETGEVRFEVLDDGRDEGAAFDESHPLLAGVLS